MGRVKRPSPASFQSICSKRLPTGHLPARKTELIEKGSDGYLRIDLAETKAGEYVGYCVGIVDRNRIGEIESVFVHRGPFRNQAIGTVFMHRAMKWMDAVGTKSRIVQVAWGNEKVWSFYKRCGFLPRSVHFEYKPPTVMEVRDDEEANEAIR